jgi:UDP-arabinose 4-epimerase
VIGDVADREAVSAALAASRAEAVMHFAASAYVGVSIADRGGKF